ncbi:MAG: TlpA family protein disulfide reductase [Chloroflexi bacterium]|nr:TlpA family protein disulfide reductase [Chloroflexota bacterium]
MSDRLSARSPQQRLIALGGLAAIVGVAVLLLWIGGVLGNQGGGEGIEDVLVLDTPPAEGRGELQVGTQKGQLAPNFEISDYDGSRHRLSDFRGQAVYVNFWATWCVPCLIEMPDIAALQDEFGDDLVVVTVNRREPLDRAETYFRNLPRLDGNTGVSFAVNGMDPDDTLYDLYRALAMPASYFIDPDGVVTTVGHGLISLEQMRTAVNESLAGA